MCKTPWPYKQLPDDWHKKLILCSVWLRYYSDVVMGMMASQVTSLMIVYAPVYSAAGQIKHQSSASPAFVRVIHRWLVNSSRRASNAENVSIWWCHHFNMFINNVILFSGSFFSLKSSNTKVFAINQNTLPIKLFGISWHISYFSSPNTINDSSFTHTCDSRPQLSLNNVL